MDTALGDQRVETGQKKPLPWWAQILLLPVVLPLFLLVMVLGVALLPFWLLYLAFSPKARGKVSVDMEARRRLRDQQERAEQRRKKAEREAKIQQRMSQLRGEYQ